MRKCTSSLEIRQNLQKDDRFNQRDDITRGMSPIDRGTRSYRAGGAAHRNCIMTSAIRNRDRELRAKNLNFQISSALCAVGEIFYDYRKLLHIQRSAYFNAGGNTDVGGFGERNEGTRGRGRESERERENEGRSGGEGREREGAWREAGVLNSHVKPPLWPIHEWNGTSGQEWGRKQLWSVTFPNGPIPTYTYMYILFVWANVYVYLCAHCSLARLLFAKSATWKLATVYH